MNYYYLGEQTMSIFKNMFSSAEKVMASALAGLAAIYAPLYVPILALSFIIIVNAFYEYKVSKQKGEQLLTRLRKETAKVFYKLRDAIVAVCGAFTIEKFIITSINFHAIEFIAGAIALIEFWSLLENLSILHPNWKIWTILQKKVKKTGEELLDLDLNKELQNDTNTNNNS